MKYVDIKGTQEVLSISITNPKMSPRFKYYYPDGIKSLGWFGRRKTYFISEHPIFGHKIYYQTPQEAIEDKEHLFTKDGKIWEYGEVDIVLRSTPDDHNYFKFSELEDLDSFLDNLFNRWGVDLGSLVCLETFQTISLYEHKSLGFRDLN